MKTLKCYLLVLICTGMILFWTKPVLALDLYTVLFEDGTKITGFIKEMNTHWIVLKTSEGKTLWRDFFDIKSIVPGAGMNAKGVDKIKETIHLKNRSLSLGFVSSDFNYEEKGLMQEKGTLYGVRAVFQQRNERDGMFQADLEFYRSDITYDGHYQDFDGTIGDSVMADTKDWLLEIRAFGGIDYEFLEGKLMTPYIGFGYRHWNDQVQAAGGYEREIKYWYVPVGFQLVSPLTGSWTVGMSMEYDIFLSGRVTSHLGDISPLLDDLHNDQRFGDGYGVRGSVQIRGGLVGDMGICVEPFVSYWDMDDSEASLIYYDTATGLGNYGIEPKNTTFHYGVRLLLEF